MDWKIRNATLGDLDEIYQIELACFDASDVFHKNTFEFFLAKRGVIFLLASTADSPQTQKERIVGFIIVQQKTFTTFEIVTIDVHPEWRSKGIGRNLLRIIEEKITEKIIHNKMPTNSFTIELVVYEKNIQAKNLYEKNGYQFVRKLANYYSSGRNGLKMEKKIELTLHKK